MLHKNFISNIELYSPEWDNARLGRMTSSKIHTLMAANGIGSGGLNYIYQKVGEFVTGKTLATEDDIIEDENTVWGIENEFKALNSFGVIKNIKYLVVQKMIYDPTSRFSSTPDALWIIDSSVTKPDYYNIATVEAKCPRKYHRFIELYRCQTPKDVRKFESRYFWQVIDQMDNCNAVLGYFVAYHPLFPEGKNTRIIEFSKLELWDEFKLLQDRKKQALQMFFEVITDFM